MPYTVKLRPPAGRALARLDKDIRRAITASLHRLAVYHIDDGQRVVAVVRVGHRREVYR